MPAVTHGLDAAVDIEQEISADLAGLYADATGDRTAIHLDEDAARSIGLPGTILQGLCTLGVVTEGLLGRMNVDHDRVRRLAARFCDTVYCGDSLRTVASPVADTATWAFESARVGGPVVVDRAHLELDAPIPAAGR
jgi:acyl dehydratase